MKNWILGMCLFFACRAVAQPESPISNPDSSATWLRFSLEEDLLKLRVEGSKETTLSSLSQSPETSFFSPFSVSVITHTELVRAGITTFPEALRLVQGFVVRQKTNGVFNVQNRSHLLPERPFLQDYETPNFLLLIDHVPVNQYFSNQIFWEALPISLQDIERIEISRSPANTLYGQNATALIHIITQRAEETKLKVRGQAQSGAFENYQANLSASWGISERLSVRLSGSYRTENRFEQNYYLLGLGRLTTSDSLLFYENNVSQTHLFTQNAQRAYQANANISYQFSEKNHLQIGVFSQFSQIQSVQQEAGHFAQNGRQTQQNQVNLHFRSPNWVCQISYLFGNQDLAKGYNGFHFDQRNLYGKTYYQLERQNWKLMTGFSYQQQSVEEQAYLKPADTVFSNSLKESPILANIGAFAQIDWQINSRFRVLGGIRNEIYLNPKYFTFNASLAFTYRLRENWLLRGGYGSTHLAFSLHDLYSRRTQTLADLRNPLLFLRKQYVPNPDLLLPQNHQFELGLRSVLWRNWQFEIEGFYILSQRAFQNQISTGNDQTIRISRQNYGESFGNKGLSASLFFRNQNVQVRAFGSVQSQESAIFSQNPQWIAGLTVNYSILFGKLNLNLMAYHLSHQQFSNYYGAPVTVPAHNTVNTKVLFKFWKEQVFYFSAQNLIRQTEAQFIFGETTPSIYQVGILLNY